MRYRAFCAAVVVVGVAGWASAVDGDYGPGKARVQLVANADRLLGGEPVFLGVSFDIKPGWHVYWKNPGGAGLATDIQWRLPAGVEHGDLLWPVPVAFTQSGDIPGYGYEGSVVLAAESGQLPRCPEWLSWVRRCRGSHARTSAFWVRPSSSPGGRR